MLLFCAARCRKQPATQDAGSWYGSGEEFSEAGAGYENSLPAALLLSWASQWRFWPPPEPDRPLQSELLPSCESPLGHCPLGWNSVQLGSGTVEATVAAAKSASDAEPSLCAESVAVEAALQGIQHLPPGSPGPADHSA